MNQRPPETPRWVKVCAFLALALIVAIAALALFGGGDHGPGRHSSPGDATGAPPPSVGESHKPPAGGHR